MGELFTMTFADFKGDEWEIVNELHLNVEWMKHNYMIEIIDIDKKIRKMTFRQGGKIVIDKIKDKYRFYWNDDDLIWLAKESVIGIRLSSHHVEKVDTQKVKNDAIVAMYT